MQFSRALLKTKPTHLIAAAAAIAGLGVAVVEVAEDHRVERSWAASLAHADQLESTLEAIDFTREALWGETEPGSAFGEYGRALELFLSNGDADGPGSNELLNLLAHASDARYGGVSTEHGERKLEKAAAFMERPSVLASFEALSRGAHSSDARPDIDWATPRGDWQVLIDRRLLTLAVRHRFHTLAEAGRGVEAAQLLLDAAQLGLDHLHAPLPVYHGMGIGILRGSFFAPFGGPCDLDALNRDGRKLLLSGLTRVIDQIEPSAHLADGELTYLTRYVERFDGLPQDFLKPEDDAMQRAGLVDWLASRRAQSQGGGEARPVHSLEDARVLFRDSLRALELALRLDLEGHASPVHDHTGLKLTADLTAETVEVAFHPSGPERHHFSAISLRRSTPE